MSRVAKWGLGTALAVVLVLVAAWLLFIGPKRAEAADLKAQRLAQEEANARLQEKIKILQAQAVELPTQRALLDKIAHQIPPTVELPALTRELARIARAAGAELQSLTPAAPTPLESRSASTQPPATPGTAGNTPAAGAGGATGTASPPGLQQVTLQIKVGGSFSQLKLFLNKFEDLSRATLVTGLTLDYGKDASAVATGTDSTSTQLKGPMTMQVTARVFVAPAGQTTAGAPAATATPNTTPAS